jgi:hypothetical protein
MNQPYLTAIEVREPGGPDASLEVHRPTPGIAEEDVLVRNQWVGVSWVDLQYAAGGPHPPLDPAPLSGLQQNPRRKGSPSVRWAHRLLASRRIAGKVLRSLHGSAE